MKYRNHTITVLCFLLLAVPAGAQEHAHADAAMPAMQTSSMKDPGLPADEASAKETLEHSPRHGEFVDISIPGSDVKLNTWVVYPERKEKAGVVIVIHEIYGLSDWIRALADQVAAEGFIAVTPDLISGMGPEGGGTGSASSRDEVVRLIRGLTAEETNKRLNAVFDFAKAIPSANGKVACVGFCWGGSTSFAYAVSQPGLRGAVVYYGTAPETGTLKNIKAPVLGMYGGDDARVVSTIDDASAEMKKLGKTYEIHIFDGAGHGFLRQQTGREGANMKATKSAWPRTVEFFKSRL